MPAWADQAPPPPLPSSVPLPFGSLSFGDFISHYQTAAYGHSVVLNELAEKLTVNLDQRWRLEAIHFQGESPLAGGFQTRVNDYEFRLAFRLDDYHDTRPTDKLGQNLHAWISWKRWNSNSVFITVPQEEERDEGAGFGVTRDPEPTGLSYFYTAGLYPSVRTSVANQRNAFMVSAGPSFALSPSFHFDLGYRYQAIRTDAHHARGQEQGIVFSLSSSF